jgi:hypothetical protein
MRFMTLVKGSENAGIPPKELFDAIAKLAQESAGVLVETGGLLPSAMGARVRVSKGKISTTDGPFTESKELVGGYAILEVKSKQEAIEYTQRFMELHKKHWPGWDGETEIRQLADPVNFGPPGGKK